jgi:hypothetical protein
MANIDQLAAVGVGVIIAVYIVVQFTPLLVNESAVVTTLAGLIAILILYSGIRFYL